MNHMNDPSHVLQMIQTHEGRRHVQHRVGAREGTGGEKRSLPTATLRSNAQ